MTLYFDKLIDRYIPTDSGWNFHPENTALLPSTEIDGKLVIEATNPLPKDYKQLMYSNVSSGGNATVYYLDMITSKDSGALPKIVRDPAASNARAIELAPETTMIFKTNYPYNKDRLKKVLCRCRKEAGAPTLHVGVIGIEDKAYKQPDGTYGNNDFYEVTVSGDITESYVTYVGYIAGTDTVENIGLVSRPNNDPDYPAKLLDGTTDIALMIRTGSGTGAIYIDSIELQDTENALTELPKGALVVNTIEGMSDDNRLTPVEKNYLVTLMSEIIAEYGDEDGTPVIGIYYAGVQAGVSSTLLTTLSTKYHALYDAMYGVDGWLTTLTDITTIDGALFNMLFDEYYSAKTAVQQETANLNNASLVLSADTGVILLTARGVLTTEEIKLTITSDRIPIANVTISRSDAGALTKIDDYHYTLDCSTVMTDTITVGVTATYLSRSYSSVVSVTKYVDPSSTPYNFGSVTVVPNLLPDGGWLATGDYFLWAGSNTTAGSTAAPVVAYPDLGKGEIYEYNGTEWVESTNGNLVMTLFDDFSKLANDVDSTVIGNAVIKNLVAINAFIASLGASQIHLQTSDRKSGCIYAGAYNADGVLTDTDGVGFWLGESGQFKANYGEFLGSLRTGADAPTGARVGIKDRTGIVSGPTFSGSGTDDLSVVKDGETAGEYQIKITQKNADYDLGFDGASWGTSVQLATGNFYKVRASGSVIICVGASGYYARSTDSGSTWTVSQNGSVAWESVAVSGTTWIMAGGYGYWSRSTDNGATWSTPAQISGLGTVLMIGAYDTTWIVGGAGKISKSTDSGATWGTVTTIGNYYMDSIYGNGTTWIIGARQGYYYVSTDGGASWSTHQKTVADDLKACLYTDGVWILGGSDGYVGISTDGGSSFTWSVVGSSNWDDIAEYNGTIVLLSSHFWACSTDRGSSWTSSSTVPSFYPYTICATNGVWCVMGRNYYAIKTQLISVDYFAWNVDGGTFSSDIAMYPIQNKTIGTDIVVKFPAYTGHVVGDTWSFTQEAIYGLKIADKDGNVYVKAGNGVFTINGDAISHFLTDEYYDSSSYYWYRLYSDGWFECGMKMSVTSSGQAFTLAPLTAAGKQFTDTNWYGIATGLTSARYVSIFSKTQTGFSAYTGDDDSFNSSPAEIVCFGFVETA